MNMNILFYGFRHGHVDGLYRKAEASPRIGKIYCREDDAVARDAAAGRLGAVFSEETYEQLLQKDVDIVAIGGCYGDRGQAVIKALRAGKHIIADKPLCTSLEELSEIRALSEAKSLKIGCMLDLRYMPAAAAAREVLQSGVLGQIRNISFDGQHCIDYTHRPGWYFEPGMHGGTVNDLAIHGVDLVRRLTGLEFAKADYVRTWNAYADRTPDFKDCAVFLARLNNGASVMADVSYSAPIQAFSLPTYWSFRFWCEKGLLTFCYTQPDAMVYEQGQSPRSVAGKAPKQDYLEDLIDEIGSGDNDFTQSVLASTGAALMLQAAAQD